jgi:hypothetical protein
MNPTQTTTTGAACCKAIETPARSLAGNQCPQCAATGQTVGDATIEAMLKPGHAHGLLEVERRFCRTPTCSILYYGTDGRAVGKDAAKERVGAKETTGPIPLCYCFGFSVEDVEREIAATGSSDIPARITAEIRAGTCACETTNPSGRCCLGDVNQAVRAATARR